MILVDTSVWIGHLRSGDAHLAALLDQAQVLAHPWVVGELALGNLQRRSDLLNLLASLPQAAVATDDELLSFIDRHDLFASGIGYVDAQLLAATRLTPGAQLWTAEKRLAAVATDLRVSFSP